MTLMSTVQYRVESVLGSIELKYRGVTPGLGWLGEMLLESWVAFQILGNPDAWISTKNLARQGWVQWNVRRLEPTDLAKCTKSERRLFFLSYVV
jgi:hypothetical protein